MKPDFRLFSVRPISTGRICSAASRSDLSTSNSSERVPAQRCDLETFLKIKLINFIFVLLLLVLFYCCYFVVSFYLFRDPLYLEKLLNSFWGRLSLWLAIGLQIVGCTIVFRILSRSARFWKPSAGTDLRRQRVPKNIECLMLGNKCVS